MQLTDFTKILINGKATKEDAAAALAQHVFDVVFLAATQRLLNALTSPAMAHYLSVTKTASVESVLRSLLDRLGALFEAAGSVTVSADLNQAFRRQCASVSDIMKTTYPEFESSQIPYLFMNALVAKTHNPNSPYYGLTLDWNLRDKNVAGLNDKDYQKVFSILIEFLPEYMTCDDRWSALTQLFEVIGLPRFSDYTHRLPQDSGTLYRSFGEYDLQNAVIAAFANERGLQHSSMPGFTLHTEGDSIRIRRAVGYVQVAKDWDTARPANDEAARERGEYAIGAWRFGYAPLLASEWLSPWTWPALTDASPTTKAEMLAWTLCGSSRPNAVEHMAAALGLPWDIINDKTPAAWQGIDPQTLVDQFTPMFTAVAADVSLPDMDF